MLILFVLYSYFGELTRLALMFSINNKSDLPFLGLAIAITTSVLFICGSVRHALFQSGAFDLGIFDNAIYLISQGQEPFVSFRGLHILGDHAAWILYLLAIPYKIYADVHWLFAIQALSLAMGALPTWYLATQAGLNRTKAYSVAIAYLFYPLLFNINLFDFHPEVIAVPLILTSVWAARAKKIVWFVAAIIFAVGCKAVLALTLIAMGIWLVIKEKRTIYGAIAIFIGVFWFAIATQLIIPAFSGEEAAAVGRYDFLGDSVTEIALNLILQPGLVLGKIFTLPNLEYMLLLFVPWLWGLSYKNLDPLFGAAPILLLNLLTDYQPQKDLIHQYSLPILPFLVLTAIATLKYRNGWLGSKRAIITWSIVTWLALAKFGYFGSRYLQSVDTLSATKAAIARISTKDAVLAPSNVVPHLTHRHIIEAIDNSIPQPEIDRFQYVMINNRHLGTNVAPELVSNLLQRLRQAPDFQLDFQQDDVFLFRKTADS